MVWGEIPGCWIRFLAAGYASWLLDMLPGNIPQGHAQWEGVGGIPGCRICCLATYLRGTLFWVVWGIFLAAGYAAWQHTLRGTLIWAVWGDIPGYWICCLATYLRGTLIGMV